jgi:MYXO-CTERM domain-containing protein
MKKLALTLAIVLGLCMTTYAEGGGLFKRGYMTDEEYYGAGLFKGTKMPGLPNHGNDDNGDADTPLGTGIALMTALGAAYLVGKRRREE